jgi:hypothetical protein
MIPLSHRREQEGVAEWLDTASCDPRLPAETIPLPFEDGPYRMQMGLVVRAPAELIDIDRHYPAQLALRRDLLATRHAEVFGACPGSEAARAEVLTILAGLLPARFPAWFTRASDRLHNHITGEAWTLATPPCDPLELAGRLVQEDLCVLQPGPAGPVLAAAVLCFPTRWKLHDKLGKPLADVHAGVPFYGERLGRPVDRLIGMLKPGRLVERLNWSLVDDPALFQPEGKWRRAAETRVTAANAGTTLLLRTERQTLSALPASGGALFTIRVRAHPLACICAAAGVAARLAGAVRALPAEMQHYKSVLPFRAALLDWLDTRGEQGS